MINKLLVIVLFLYATSVVADQTLWEYQVMFLPGTAGGSSVEKHQSGGYIDTMKTKILNSLSKEGWEVISVTGSSGADHAVYMRRQG